MGPVRHSGIFVDTSLSAILVPFAILFALPAGLARPAAAQGPQAATGAAVNDLPNPFSTVEGWAKLPEGRTWGSLSAVEIDKNGTSIWVAERCGKNSCLDSSLDPIMKFDASGKLVASFGAGMFIFPHGMYVDRGGNVWVTDGQDNLPRRPRSAAADAPLPPVPPVPAIVIGHQVFKFSPTGKLLMTLGKKGGGKGDDFLWQPNDVLVAPNGTIFVAEGHGGDNARILKFNKAGKLLKTWGQKGSGPEDLDQPHALAMDSKGRLFVGDRGNNRIKIFNQEGRLLDTWFQFSRPSGMYIDRNDLLYVADSESGSVEPKHSEWKRGIRIGSARDGVVRLFIPDPAVNPPSTSSAEGVAVDAKGNVYGAEVGQRALKRYEKKP